MEEASNLFDKYCYLVTHSTNGAQIGIYSVAIIGLSVALRRVRPFSRFTKPSDVPKRFFDQKRELTGYVQRIEPTGALLMVQHKPLIGVHASKASLPVKIAGVNTTGNAISWLQCIVAGNNVNFIPISRDSRSLHCEVILPQLKQQNKLQFVNVGEQLVSIGFGQVKADKVLRERHLIYLSKLEHAEKVALRRQLGLKYYLIPAKVCGAVLLNKLNSLMAMLITRVNKTAKIAAK